MSMQALTKRLGLAILAIVAGGMLALAFPEPGWWWSGILAVALITGVQWRGCAKRGLLTGFLFGFTFFLFLQPWLHVVGTDAWILLSAYCALWFAGMGAMTAWVTRFRLAPLWVGALWVVQEWGRGTIPFGGYSWGRLAFSQSDSIFAQGANWWGMTGLTFIIATLGTVLAQLVLQWRTSWKRHLAVLSLVIIVITTLSLTLPSLSQVSGTSTIAIVQGGTPQTGMGAMDVRAAVLENHIEVTRSLASSIATGQVDKPDLVVWPENASDIDPFADPMAFRAIADTVDRLGVPVLVGAVITSRTNPNYRENVGILWMPDSGPATIYAKSHPVPFGEFIPFREILAGLTDRFDRIPRDFAAGSEPGIFSLTTPQGTLVFGDAICFEVAYDDVMVTLVDKGSNLITVQTNNATYAGTDQISQQLAIERLRAVQLERSVAIAATTGASAIFDSQGSELASIPIDGQGFAIATVNLYEGTPMNVRFGLLPEYASVVAILGLLIVSIRGRRHQVSRDVG